EGALKSQLQAKFEVGEWTIGSYDATLFEKTWPLAAQDLSDAGCSDGGMDGGVDAGMADAGAMDAGEDLSDAGTVLDAGATAVVMPECVRGFAWQNPLPIGGSVQDLWTWGSQLWAVTD